MSEKEAKEGDECETVAKTEEIGESLPTEEAAASFETIASEPPSRKNKANTQAKVYIMMRATANAPIMKQKRWSIGEDRNIGWISEFLSKYLKLEPTERLFIYVNQTFAPPPDQTVKNLYDCFGADGKLILYYCKNHAWG